MRKKIMSLMLAVVMLLSLAVPVFGAEAASAVDVLFDDIISNYEPEDVVTQDVLDDIATAMAGELMTYAEDDAAEESKPVNMEDGVIWFLRNISGMEDRQLSTAKFGTAQFAYDCVELLRSMDILPAGYAPEGAFTYAQLSALVSAGAPLVEAMHADKMQPLFMNGMAQPIFPFTPAYTIDGTTLDYEVLVGYQKDAEGKNVLDAFGEPIPVYGKNKDKNGNVLPIDNYVPTSNEGSDIVRFCVYVETNYDTDGDGKLDLVKALVQLPRAAMEGDYRAATIYEARPYITGCTGNSTPYQEGSDFDVASLYDTQNVVARETAGVATTKEAAAAADANDWVYWNPHEEMYDYEDLTWYDYYLVRGFAVVECGGLGTKGSEGYETCGTDLEIDAFKCVIEWLNGDSDRRAFTNKEDNIEIKADWSNHSVGMTGRSYAGTTQFGLATTGVDGLKTIVPVAGIASWYEYTNSQGIYMRNDSAYSNSLAWMCNGRYLDSEDYAKIQEDYQKYLSKITDIQHDLNGDYANENDDDHWSSRDYTQEPLMDDWKGIQIPALIVHGLNDTNVKTKQSDLMYKKFVEAYENVKMLFHWNGHLTPTYPAGGTEIKIGNEYYDSILNKWFSHYLYSEYDGTDNGIENMAAVTVQDNVDGSWKTYNSWDAELEKTLNCSDGTEDVTSTVAGAIGHYEEVDGRNRFIVDTPAVSATYTFDVPEDVTIKGPVAVHIHATVSGEDLANKDAVKITVGLRDKSETAYNAYMLNRNYLPNKTVRENGGWVGGGADNFDLVEYGMTSTKNKSIGEGYIDVFNPSATYVSSSAVKESITAGAAYDYTVYIQPTFYTVKAGHTMELSLSIPTNNSGVTLTVDNNNTFVELPVNTAVATVLPEPILTTTVERPEPEEPTPTPPTSGGSSGGTVTKPVETSPVDKFIDVNTGDWFADAVNYVVNKGLMAGVSETTFGPSIDTTRGMIVTILYRLENEPTAGTANFNDVASGQYYANAVAWASANNIVSGYGDGNFGPNDAITREQLVAILFRYAEYKGYDLTKRADLSAFADETSISEYAVDAMSWANAMGLVSGVSDTMIAPTNRAVRAQVAMIFMSFCEKIVK